MQTVYSIHWKHSFKIHKILNLFFSATIYHRIKTVYAQNRYFAGEFVCCIFQMATQFEWAVKPISRTIKCAIAFCHRCHWFELGFLFIATVVVFARVCVCMLLFFFHLFCRYFTSVYFSQHFTSAIPLSYQHAYWCANMLNANLALSTISYLFIMHLMQNNKNLRYFSCEHKILIENGGNGDGMYS